MQKKMLLFKDENNKPKVSVSSIPIKYRYCLPKIENPNSNNLTTTKYSYWNRLQSSNSLLSSRKNCKLTIMMPSMCLLAACSCKPIKQSNRFTRNMQDKMDFCILLMLNISHLVDQVVVLASRLINKRKKFIQNFSLEIWTINKHFDNQENYFKCIHSVSY